MSFIAYEACQMLSHAELGDDLCYQADLEFSHNLGQQQTSFSVVYNGGYQPEADITSESIESGAIDPWVTVTFQSTGLSV